MDFTELSNFEAGFLDYHRGASNKAKKDLQNLSENSVYQTIERTLWDNPQIDEDVSIDFQIDNAIYDCVIPSVLSIQDRS